MIFTGSIEGMVADVQVQEPSADEAATMQEAAEAFAADAMGWCGPEQWADFYKVGLLRGSPPAAVLAADFGVQAMYARFRETEE
jgi:hypothetical protein